jgi:hypothetical protein
VSDVLTIKNDIKQKNREKIKPEMSLTGEIMRTCNIREFSFSEIDTEITKLQFS